MRRRHLLRTGLLACLPAGCLDRAPGTGDGREPTLVEADLAVRDRPCGTRVDEASVSFDADARSVVVDGTIPGSDTCHTARLRAATYDPAADRLTVHVVAVRRASDGEVACGQCIVAVDYAATCTFEGGLPGRVRVVHGTGDRRTVVTTVGPS